MSISDFVLLVIAISGTFLVLGIIKFMKGE
jgi:hypothetical protein